MGDTPDITESLLGALDGAEITMDVGVAEAGASYATRITVIGIEDDVNAQLLGDTIVDLMLNYGLGTPTQ